MSKWDVIVVGGGHAGTEAAHAAARLGCKTALLTMNPTRIGFMSCNPAIGGLAKGQLVKEIDALGGIMGINTDRAAIQYRRLNSSKGAAVRSSRAQCDKSIYAKEMQTYLATVENLTIISAEADQLLVKSGAIFGLKIKSGETLEAQAVVLTTGTFLKAIMYTGEESLEGGRLGDEAAKGLSAGILDLGHRLRRLKTGTPPRLDIKTLDISKTCPQPGDEKPVPFSFYFKPEKFPVLPQIQCYITYTNAQTHEIISKNFNRSPMFTGVIKGVGPRYCPSIEDKVKRFAERDRHQIFLEPEGLNTNEVYVNGISTSLPKDVQEAFVRTIPGCEKAEFIKFGYAVEYDAIDATQLRSTLESKNVSGLFFGGQINGTSGYEEAGAQGLIAGINAALQVRNEKPFTLSRLDGYIGVMIDDLILKGEDEPYRMFTSRAEYRLLLREDNADLRLSEKSHEIGLLSEKSYQMFTQRREAISRGLLALQNNYINPVEKVNEWFSARGLATLKDRVSGISLLRRPEVSMADVLSLGIDLEPLSEDVSEQIEIQVKYEGYIKRDLELLEGVRKSEELKIPEWLKFSEIPGLSNEARARLEAVRPETVGQAGRLPGVTPATIANMLIFMKTSAQRRADKQNAGG